MTSNFNQKANICIEGIGNISSGDYGKVSVEGVAKINGDIGFEKMIVEGTCNTNGDLHGDLLDVQGVLKAMGDVKLKRLDVEGVMKTEKNKIYADVIMVQGILKNEEEVNADRICIEGCVTLNDLFGDEITINYSRRMMRGFSFFFDFGKKWLTRMNTANNIECTTLSACNITCHHISGTDIQLQDHCVVDTITCNGTLHYDSTCVIKHIEGDCMKIRDEK